MFVQMQYTLLCKVQGMLCKVLHKGIVYNYVSEITHNIFLYTLMYLEAIIFKLNLNYIYKYVYCV